MKTDDSNLPTDTLIAVRKQALQALNNADALGIFPTPVDQILDAVNVVLAPEEEFGQGLLDKFKKKFGHIADSVKRAMSKVIGFLDVPEKIIFVEKHLYPSKKTFLKLHETGHAFLPWQTKAYALIEDCEQTLDADIADLFDREANVFAKEVLFQCGAFAKEAADFELGLSTPVKLHDKYGASIYASIREYVRSNHRACTVLVLDKPILCTTFGFTANLRRIEASAEFLRLFGSVQWPLALSPNDPLGSLIPLGKQWGASKPKPIMLVDTNGCEHECLAESLTNGYQVFILVCPVLALTKKSIIIPSSLF
jgi:hypothetical protein